MAVLGSPFLVTAFCGVVFVASASADTGGCPASLASKYVRSFRDRCYLFAVYEERYWNDAKTACQRLGGQLASIPDAQTQSFLAQSLSSLSFHGTGVWIGLTDQGHEGDWRWATGERVAYKNWVPGQPGFASSIEDCALMERNHGYRWADYHCHIWPQHYGFICQFDIKRAPTTQAPTTTVPITSTSTTMSTTLSTPPLPTTMSTTKSTTQSTTWSTTLPTTHSSTSTQTSMPPSTATTLATEPPATELPLTESIAPMTAKDTTVKIKTTMHATSPSVTRMTSLSATSSSPSSSTVTSTERSTAVMTTKLQRMSTLSPTKAAATSPPSTKPTPVVDTVTTSVATPAATNTHPSVTYPAFCGDFMCGLACAAYQTDDDGCPICTCKS